MFERHGFRVSRTKPEYRRPYVQVTPKGLGTYIKLGDGPIPTVKVFKYVGRSRRRLSDRCELQTGGGLGKVELSGVIIKD